MNSIPNLDLIQKDIKSFSCKSKNTNISKTRLTGNVLLTGATGFLGRYIIKDLLVHTDANIYCLVRRSSRSVSIKDKLNQKLSEAGLEINNKRLILLEGDLSMKNLGISDDTLDELDQMIDSVYHCGAFVHHLHSYKVLRQDVIATEFLIDFAINKKRQKQLHYVSTMSLSNPSEDIWRPAQKLEDLEFRDMGYIQVKWACEKILYTYIDNQYPFYIYRPGNITGHSKTGYILPWSNHALLLLKGFLQEGTVPEWIDLVEMTPVDLVSKAIVKLSLNNNNDEYSQIAKSPKNKIATFNLHNSSTLCWREYIQKVAEILKYKVKFVERNYWRTEILPSIEDVKSPLSLFKDFYSLESNRYNIQPPRDTVTEYILQKQGVQYPTKNDYDELIKVYLNFLLRINFLTLPRGDTQDTFVV